MGKNTVPNSLPSKKTKGLIRWEAVIPICLILIISGLYFSLLFDRHLRQLIEYTGTYVHGAEVNIDKLKTSFWKGTFQIHHLQVTDKKDPSRNLFSIGEIRFSFLWDALLRAKFVVTESAIESIKAYSPRQKPGRIIPPTENKNKSEALAKLETSILNQTKKEFEGNFISDISKILEGKNISDQLQDIEKKLKSNSSIKNFENSFNEKKKNWEVKLNSLPKNEEIKKIETKIKNLRINYKDPISLANDLKEIQPLVKEAEEKINHLKSISDSINKDISSIDLDLKKLDQTIKEDIKDLENRFQIPSIDAKDFSIKIFGNMFAEKLITIQKYMTLARTYMPPQNENEKKIYSKKEEIIPKPRGSGVNYEFPILTGYPLFWLKKAIISSTLNNAEYSGEVKGEIYDVTSHPMQIKKPTIIKISADFPQKDIRNLNTNIEMDHTTNIPKDTMKITIGSFPFPEKKIFNNSDVSFNLSEGKTSSELKLELVNDQLNINLNNQIQNPKYEVDGKSKTVKELLNNTLQTISLITLNAHATGTWDHLNMSINSNLGSELSYAFTQQIKKIFEENKTKIRQNFEEKINKEKIRVLENFNQTKNNVTGEIENKTVILNQLKNEMNNQIKNNKIHPEQIKNKQLDEGRKKILEGIKKNFKIN